MKVVQVYKGGLANKIGLRSGDEIISINGHQIRDSIDFHFWINDPAGILKIMRGRETLILQFSYIPEKKLGIKLEPFKFHCCGNRCLFCFVDQNPKGLRAPLYFKDEDYRLSFLYGNYVTLTRVSRRDLNRIVEQRLTPLYISVHAVNRKIRQKLLGLRNDDRLLEKIEFLAKNKIQMHAQIVLCPGINDGLYLERTVDTLAAFYPAVKTVAIVPVGLTKHRRSLYPLTAVSPQIAEEMINWCQIKAAHFKKYIKSAFIFLADEFYLMAGRAIPASAFYEDYHQIENGVGMTRTMLDIFYDEKKRFPVSIPATTIDIVTAQLVAPILLKKVIPVLNRIKGLRTRLRIIRNDFFGESVTVTGLLTGQDIIEQVRQIKLGHFLVLPLYCVNEDGLFLDNVKVTDLQRKLSTQIIQPSSFLDIFRKIA